MNIDKDDVEEEDDLEDIQQIDHVPLDDVIHDKLLLHMNKKSQDKKDQKEHSPPKLKKTKRDIKENKKHTRKQVRFT